MIIRPCDVETTGLEASDEVIEIGFTDLRYVSDIWGLSAVSKQAFIRPARPIPPESSGIHHITDDDVKDAPSWADGWRMLVETPNDDGKIIFAAHAARYERQYLDPLIHADWICTWKCSLRQWPDFASHKLQALRYFLNLPVDPDRASPPHRAAPDSYVCGMVVLELLEHQTVETLLQWSSEPAVFTKFDFGQFDGKPLSVADDGYLDWLANKDHKMGEDWRWNARRQIERRLTVKRKQALDLLLPAIAGAATVTDLENWYHGSAEYLAKHGITIGSADYQSLISACAARKKVLIEGGQPQFGTAS